MVAQNGLEMSRVTSQVIQGDEQAVAIGPLSAAGGIHYLITSEPAHTDSMDTPRHTHLGKTEGRGRKNKTAQCCPDVAAEVEDVI